MHLLVLGSGLRDFVRYLDVEKVVHFGDIPGCRQPTVEGHEGAIYFGRLGAYAVAIVCGRLHYYEGFSPDEIVKPLRWVKAEYDITSVCITNASGALDQDVEAGEVYRVKKGICFCPYQDLPRQVELNIDGVEYVYAFSSGPTFGTRSEYKYYSLRSCSFVGMSGLPEFSIVQYWSSHKSWLTVPVCQYFPFKGIREPSHAEVLRAAHMALPKLKKEYIAFISAFE